MEAGEADTILRRALSTLYAEHVAILVRDAHERTLCGALSSLLSEYFPNHEVHVEYDRHGFEPKEIELPGADGVLTTQRVFPDIIVHNVGHDIDNLIVIEVKKSTNPQPDGRDLMKLRHIREQIDYKHAAFVRLSTGTGAALANVRVEWV